MNHIISEKKKPTLSNIILGYAAAILFVGVVVGFFYSFWTQRGPYQWLVSAQYSLMESYSQKLTLLILLLLFTPCVLVLLIPVMRAGKWARLVAFLPICVMVAMHFSIAVYYFATGGRESKVTTLAVAAHSAHFLPRAVTLERKDWAAMNVNDSTHVPYETSSMSQESMKYRGEHFTHFTLIQSADLAAFRKPIVCKSGGYMLEQMSTQTHVDGIIYQSPLPYLFRRNEGLSDAPFGIVFSYGESIREYWSSFVLLYGVIIAGIVLGLFSRRAKR